MGFLTEFLRWDWRHDNTVFRFSMLSFSFAFVTSPALSAYPSKLSNRPQLLIMFSWQLLAESTFTIKLIERGWGAWNKLYKNDQRQIDGSHFRIMGIFCIRTKSSIYLLLFEQNTNKLNYFWENGMLCFCNSTVFLRANFEKIFYNLSLQRQ